MELVRLPSGFGAVVFHDGREPLVISQIIGIGRNYADHAHEQGVEPATVVMAFTKNPLSVALDGEEIVLPVACADREQVDYEGELAVVLGRDVRDVDESEVLEADGPVLGYCCANDVSARWWQKEGGGGQFYRGKSFDTFCPLGPRVTPASAIDDPMKLRLVTRLNGEVMQDGTTGDMTFGVARLIAELSMGTTLSAGTVVLTGTPAGVGQSRRPPRFLRHGDEVEVEIEGLGILRNGVSGGVSKSK